MKKLILILFLFPYIILSQSPCGTDEYNQPFIESNPTKYQKIENNIQSYLNSPNPKRQEQLKIPVVFHIVWKDSVENLPDSIIYQQLEVLNVSFNLLNTDTSILTDTLKNLPGKFGISFKIRAITRHHTNNNGFTYYNNAVKFDSLGGVDAWDTKKYMNIWICDLYTSLLGYSQFPGGPDETDGNVVDYSVVGNKQYPWTYNSNYTLGRILVHEVGHWLNLYHPWGNTGWCSDDFVDDTGLQDGPTHTSQNCPDTSFSQCPTPEREIVKHYMDYCGDSCMVMFTKGQVERGLASLYVNRFEMVGEPSLIIPNNPPPPFKIYPTITSGIVNIEGFNNNKTTINIYNLEGKLVYTKIYTYSNSIQINLYNLKNGVYTLQFISDNNKPYLQKIIISKNNIFRTEYPEEIKLKDDK